MVFLVIGIYPISSVSTIPFQSSFLRDWCVSHQVESNFFICNPVQGRSGKVSVRTFETIDACLLVTM